MQKRLREMAVARTAPSTELTMAALSGPVLRKMKNSAANECRNGEDVRAEEDENAEGQRERGSPERNEIESAVVGALPAVRNPAAGNGAGDAIDNCNARNHQAGVGDGEADRTMQKGRHPGGDAAERECDLRQAKG